jgi:hypothetical protein
VADQLAALDWIGFGLPEPAEVLQTARALVA